MGCHFLLWGIFPTQGLNPGLLLCRQILYHLSLHRCPEEATKGSCMVLKPLIRPLSRMAPALSAALLVSERWHLSLDSSTQWRPLDGKGGYVKYLGQGGLLDKILWEPD